jgi:hypothetical protein
MSTPSDLTERAAEDAGAVDAGLGLNPLVGFGAADVLAAFGRIGWHAARHPLVTLQHQIELASQILRGLTGGSNIEPREAIAGSPIRSGPAARSIAPSSNATLPGATRSIAGLARPASTG